MIDMIDIYLRTDTAEALWRLSEQLTDTRFPS